MMKVLSRVIAAVCLVALVATSFSLTAGCRKSSNKRKHRTIQGTALRIDEATGQVSMRFFHDDTNQYRTVEGIVTPETEILINGRVAQLGEVRVNDEVVVTGYVEKDGLSRRVVATKVRVQRDEWSKGGGTSSKPASTKPAAKPKADSAKKPTPKK